MATVAPNLSTLIGELVAARLISKAGSLTSLAKCPASTVQILGAEKVDFLNLFIFPAISLLQLLYGSFWPVVQAIYFSFPTTI